MCGVADNSEDCGVGIQKDLFTPRLGIAYRPFESTVIRAGFSRNPQNDHMYRNATYTYPASVTVTNVGLNAFHPAGTLDQGFPLITAPDISSGVLALPAGVGVTSSPGSFTRGRLTAYNVTVQQQIGESMSVQLGYGANRQREMTRSTNRNYGQIGGGVASQPFFQSIGTNANINFLDPLGRVDYDALQLHMTRRMHDGFSFTAAYTYAKSTDWWATGILIPDYRSLNLGDSSTVSPNKFDLSASDELPFGEGRRFLNEGIGNVLLGGWQLNANFTAFSGQVMTMTANGASLNAPGNPQRADQVADFKVLEDSGRTPTGSIRRRLRPSRSALRQLDRERLSRAWLRESGCEPLQELPD